MFTGRKPSFEEITPKEAQKRLSDPSGLFVLDVREPEEYQSGHIAEAVLIPLGQLSQRRDELPQDRDILCVCQTGSRSSFAASRLAAAGYRVINLRGGISAWERDRLPMQR